MARPAISLKARALRYLSAREHSRIELSRKLARYAQEGDDIEQLLDSLEAAKFLSQARFCDSLINRRAKRFGNSRILAELQSHGVSDQDLSSAKAGLIDGEIARACEVWQRKFGHGGAAPADRAKQMRFMQQRGFSHQAIKAAMAGAMPDEEDGYGNSLLHE
ncbi:MAG: recombination regulator RecX [Pseudomonadota bacterium]